MTPTEASVTAVRAAAAHLARHDPSEMWRRLRELPEQVIAASNLAERWKVPDVLRSALAASPVNRIVFVGMGGSAIGGQIIASVAERRVPIAVELVRNDALPRTDDHTLIVLASFSGETGEVLEAFRQLRERNGPAVVVTRGGTLAREATAAGVPVLRYEYDGEPRSALGYGTFLLLGLLHRLHLVPFDETELHAIVEELRDSARRCEPASAAESNPGRSVAAVLRDAIPLIVADAGLTPAAVRWQNQLNENGKRWAFPVVLPEALHNVVEGLYRGRSSRDGEPLPFHAVLLQDGSESAAARARMAALSTRLSDVGLPWTQLRFTGHSDLSRLLQACLVGDWVSYYLAVDEGVDPSPVPVITRMKQQVAELEAKQQEARHAHR